MHHRRAEDREPVRARPRALVEHLIPARDRSCKDVRVLWVGLTGGIGSGKSTVARRLVERGATLIDADALSREVLAAGSDGLAAVVEGFGSGVLHPDGSLNRAALAEHVFADDSARMQLNEIVHPRVADRTAEMVARAPSDAIVVHDIPLLVENGYAAGYHLVVVVDAPVEDRVARLVERGLGESDARARIRAQASDEDRREAADVWLDNDGPVEQVLAEVDRLWDERLVPFEANARAGRRADGNPPRLVDPDPEWPRDARRLADRIERAGGEAVLRVDHIGSTAVPGIPAKDVVDLQVTVRGMDEADALAEPLGRAGFPVLAEILGDTPHGADADPDDWRKRVHASADPGRRANVHLRGAGSAGWRSALLLRDWLWDDPSAREDYLALKRRVAAQHADDPDHDGYADAKEPWFDDALRRAERWAEETGWRPPQV